MATSLYVHVPFCVVKCGYCDFNSFEVDDDTVLDTFLDGLDQELTLTVLPENPRSIFIGGGTPSFLDPRRLERFFATLRRHVDITSVREITMESNPESVTEDKARIARDAGVTRMSIGAQTFDSAHLAFLDRAHTADQTRDAVRAIRDAGHDNLSLDLMFGLPGQTPTQWQKDLELALELEPDHLSCYNLTFEPGTRLEHARREGRVAPNPTDTDREMFLHTRTRLRDAGFTAYEISNFAGRGGPCSHNDHYWLQGNYVGIGPGASSHRDGVRHTNLKPLNAWSASLARGVPPTAEAETLSPRRRIGEALWLGIRRREGVHLDRLARRLGALDEFESTIRDLEARGWISRSPDGIALTDEGLLFADTVGEQFLV